MCSILYNAKIIQLGPDPLFARSTPMRSFRSDVTLSGDTSTAIQELISEIRGLAFDKSTIAARKTRLREESEAERLQIFQNAERGCQSPMTKEWVSYCLGQAIKGLKATVFHELGCPLPPLQIEHYNSYFQEPHSGGLGWGLPAAMGAQLAVKHR